MQNFKSKPTKAFYVKAVSFAGFIQAYWCSRLMHYPFTFMLAEAMCDCRETGLP